MANESDPDSGSECTVDARHDSVAIARKRPSINALRMVTSVTGIEVSSSRHASVHAQGRCLTYWRERVRGATGERATREPALA